MESILFLTERPSGRLRSILATTTAAVEVVECAYGLSVFDPSATAKLATGCYGKVVLFAKQPLTISAACSAQLLEEAGTLPWPHIADIPMAGSEILVGQPVMTLFAEADSCEAVAQRLRQRVAQMERFLTVE